MTESDERLSRLYRAGQGDGRDAGPGELADARIRRAARAAVAPRRRGRLVPLATAATVLLAMGLLLRLPFEALPPSVPEEAGAPARERAVPPPVADVRTRLPDEPLPEAVGPRVRQAEKRLAAPAKAAVEAGFSALDAAPAGRSMPADTLLAELSGLDADAVIARLRDRPDTEWTAVVEALRRAGRTQDADAVARARLSVPDPSSSPDPHPM